MLEAKEKLVVKNCGIEMAIEVGEDAIEKGHSIIDFQTERSFQQRYLSRIEGHRIVGVFLQIFSEC